MRMAFPGSSDEDILVNKVRTKREKKAENLKFEI